MRIDVIDATGTTVRSTVADMSMTDLDIDLRSVAAGIYFVRCMMGDAVMTMPVVRQ
jgi:hypothetical protein